MNIIFINSKLHLFEYLFYYILFEYSVIFLNINIILRQCWEYRLIVHQRRRWICSLNVQQLSLVQKASGLILLSKLTDRYLARN